MKNLLLCRRSLATAVVVLLAAAQSGCRSNAYNDLYRQKMASEIRVLEDQLYEADYQNEVLRDKLQRQQELNEALQSEDTAPDVDIDVQPDRREPTPRVQIPVPDPDTNIELEPVPPLESREGFQRRESPDETRSLDEPPSLDETELELPEMDPGVPVDRSDAATRDSSSDSDARSQAPLQDPIPQTQPRQAKPSDDDAGLLPAPTEPQPPGREDTEVPLEIPGEILPPPASPEEIVPPGQIQLPDSVQASNDAPKALRIHRGLSGGHRVDGKLEGMTVVVNVVDSLGKTLNLDDFDINADLSVVLLDPEREPHEARIGRWDFPHEEVLKLVRDQPISGLHIPVQWQKRAPQGDEVIVHVRLRAEEDEMRCEQRIKVEAEPAVAQWTPRGDAAQDSSTHRR